MAEMTPLAAVFDRAADTYDQVGVEMFGPIAERLVTALAPRPGERAADLGCGRGAALVRLGRATGEKVVGVDLAPAMVGQARAQAAAAGIEAEVRVGDAQDPGLPAASFDVVASSLVIFFLPDAVAALRAWRALLVPGGRLGVTTFGPPCPLWRATNETFHPYLPTALRRQREHAPDSPFESTDGMTDLFARAGLVGVRSVRSTVPVRFVDEDQWLRWSWSGAWRGMWEAVPENARGDLTRDLFALLQDFRGADGRIGFDQEVLVTVGVRPEAV